MQFSYYMSSLKSSMLSGCYLHCLDKIEPLRLTLYTIRANIFRTRKNFPVSNADTLTGFLAFWRTPVWGLGRSSWACGGSPGGSLPFPSHRSAPSPLGSSWIITNIMHFDLNVTPNQLLDIIIVWRKEAFPSYLHDDIHLPWPMSKEIFATARSLDTSLPGCWPGSGRFANSYKRKQMMQQYLYEYKKLCQELGIHSNREVVCEI